MKDQKLKIIILGIMFLMLLSGFNPLLVKTGESTEVDEEFSVKPDYLSDDMTYPRNVDIFRDDTDFMVDDMHLYRDSFSEADKEEPEFVSGEIIVKLKSDAGIEFLTYEDGIAKIGISYVDRLNERHNVVAVEKIFKSDKKPIDDSFGLSSVYKFVLLQDSDILSVVKDYNKDLNVEYAEPNYIYHTCMVPNDPDFDEQWSLNQSNDCDIDAPEAWDIETGDSDVNIAVIDTGVDYTHPDLAGNIWINEDEIPDNDIDDDENGFVDDIRGWDFFNDTNDPIDYHGHGTHCSGIASAVGNNSVGISGVCWDCSIMALKGFNSEGSGYLDDLAEAICYAADNGADVISMSWGSGFDSQLIRDAIDYAYSRGVVLVAAAGNFNTNRKFYPAGYDNVIAVAATNSTDAKASFSNYGSWIDVSAPGVAIYSTMPTYNVTMNDYGYKQGYDNCSGTSMACPHVAGLIGLILSYDNYSQLTNDEVVRRVTGTADDIYNMNPSYQVFLGSGRINAHKALIEEPQPHFIYLSHEISNRGFSVNETSELWFRIKNIWLAATNVTITLHTDNEYISITNGDSYLGDVGTDEIVDNENNLFILTVELDYPDEEDLTLTLIITADGEYKQEIILIFPVWGCIRWVPTDGPILDVVSSIAIDPVDANIIYAATGTYAIFVGVPAAMPVGVCKSTDGGQNWNAKNYGLDCHALNVIVVDPDNSDVLYTGTRDGLYKSINGAQRWTKLTNGLPGYGEPCNILSIAIDPYDSRIIYVGSREGVYKSEDEGESWTLTSHGLPQNPYISCLAIHSDITAVHKDATRILYAGTSQYGIYKSIDNGQRWRPVNNGLPQGCYIASLAISQLNPHIIYAGVSLWDTYYGLYKSTNGGRSWVNKSTGLPENAEIECIAVDPYSSDIVYVGTGKGRNGGAFPTTKGDGAYRTTDGGDNWTNISHGLPSEGCVASLVIDPKNPDIIYAGTQVGVYKGVKGVYTTTASYTTAYDDFIWEPLHKGWPPDSIVYCLVADPNDDGPVYAGTSPLAVFKKEESQEFWKRMNNGLSTFSEVDAMIIDRTDPSKLYLGTYLGGVKKSIDYGESWVSMNEGLPEDARWIISLAINPTNSPTLRK